MPGQHGALDAHPVELAQQPPGVVGGTACRERVRPVTRAVRGEGRDAARQVRDHRVEIRARAGLSVQEDNLAHPGMFSDSEPGFGGRGGCGPQARAIRRTAASGFAAAYYMPELPGHVVTTGTSRAGRAGSGGGRSRHG